DKEGNVVVRDAVTGRERSRLSGVKGPLRCLAVGTGGTTAAAGDEAVVRLWDAAGRQRPPLDVPGKRVIVLAFSPEERLLAAGGEDGTVHVWDVVSGKRRDTLTGHDGPVRALAFHQDRFLVSGSNDGTVQVWD